MLRHKSVILVIAAETFNPDLWQLHFRLGLRLQSIQVFARCGLQSPQCWQGPCACITFGWSVKVNSVGCCTGLMKGRCAICCN
jgi:hypothetical protein